MKNCDEILKKKKRKLIRWTKEKIYEISINCNTKKEFNKKCPSAYSSAYKLGILDEVTSHMKILHKIWKKDELSAIALKYDSKKSFREGNFGAYLKISRENWFDEMCGHFKDGKKPNNYWNKNRLHEEALKYKTIKEFTKSSKSASSIAYKSGYFEEITQHMVNLNNNQKRLVYMFIFPNNYIYIGLTYNIEERYHNHIFPNEKHSKKSSVYKHMIKTKTIPILSILTDYINVEDAIKMEKLYIIEYRKSNFNVLNKKVGGAIGCGIKKWTYESCKNEANKYDNRSEFYNKSINAYRATCKYKWLDDFFPLNNKINLNYDICKKLINKYKNKTDFKLKKYKVYIKCKKEGWLDDFFPLKEKYELNYGYCKKESLKYETKTILSKKNRPLYNKCRMEKWLEEFFPNSRNVKK